MNVYSLAREAVAALTVLLFSSVAWSQDIKLRAADSFPPGHFNVKFASQVWMDRVVAESGGRVTFDYFPSEQLGKAKDLLSLTQSGVIDLGFVTIGLVSDKLPLAAVVELPEPFTNSCEATLAYWPLAREGGIIDREEFAPLGVRALFVLVTPPYQLYMAREPLTPIAAVRGKKIRTAGAAKMIVARQLGAVGVFIPGPEILESLSRGTVDGMMLSPPSIVDYDLHPHLKYATIDANFGSAVSAYFINRENWESLPADVRELIDRAGDDVTRSSCAALDDDVRHDLDIIRKAGTTFVKLGADDRRMIESAMTEVSRTWAADLDRRGKKGSAALEAFRAGLQRVKAD